MPFCLAPLNKVQGPTRETWVSLCLVTNRTQGTESYDAETEKNSMMNEKAYRLQMQSVEILKEKLGVEDNRFRFF